MTGSSIPTPHRPSRVRSAVPAATATGSAARTGRPGRHPTPNYTPRTAATAPCTSKPGTACIPSSPDADDGPTTTPRRSWPEPSSASTSNTYPNPPRAPKRHCGCGLPAQTRSTSTPAGEPICAASISNTPSGSARTPSGGPPHDCAPPNKPTADLDHRRRLHPTSARPTPGRRPATALEETRQTRQTHPRPCPARVSTTCRNPGHARQPTKTQQGTPGTSPAPAGRSCTTPRRRPRPPTRSPHPLPLVPAWVAAPCDRGIAFCRRNCRCEARYWGL